MALRISQRCFHTSSKCLAAPLPTALDKASRTWTHSRTNPNTSTSTGNLDLAFSLLRKCHERDTRQTDSDVTQNIILSPFELEQRLSTDADALARVRAALNAPLGDKERTQAVEQSLKENPASASWTSGSNSSNARFDGLLAPRFALTDTASPSWFIPTIPEHVKEANKNCKVALDDPYPVHTNVTPLERRHRVPASMIYRSDKLWYVEDSTCQMIDVPYLHPAFSLTLILPRFTAAQSIDNHPQTQQYADALRTKSSVDEVIQSMSGARVVEAFKHASLMQGLLILPTFDAQYRLDLSSVCPDLKSPMNIGSSFSLSGTGLQRGGLRHVNPRNGDIPPRFLASAHRPFVALVRHRETNTVLHIAKIEQVTKDERVYKYHNRRIQWIEDHQPIKQYD